MRICDKNMTNGTSDKTYNERHICHVSVVDGGMNADEDVGIAGNSRPKLTTAMRRR